MLKQLQFENVGPAKSLKIEFRERLNFLAGDNGLGKTFLLDAAWWALTRTWAHRKLLPHKPPAAAAVFYRFGARTTDIKFRSTFDRGQESWSKPPNRPGVPGLVVYAQADGSFSVWDPARNYWKGEANRPKSYQFNASSVWDGNDFSEGLIRDWASWQREDGTPFQALKAVLRALSSPDLPLEPGELRKISLDDPKKHPTLKTPYSEDVPLVHASSGIRRIVALAYVLVWTWQEHLEAAWLRGDATTREIILLIDEVEAHLHPLWQRRIVPALLNAISELTGHPLRVRSSGARPDGNGTGCGDGISYGGMWPDGSDGSREVDGVQIIAATHSPLVLASTEPMFDPERDAIWELDLVQNKVTLSLFPWTRRGDANAWLTSSVFNLEAARSEAAERALRDANKLVESATPLKADVESVNAALKAALSDIDPFWMRWTYWRNQQS